jgi:hypothetical protein
VDKQQQQQETGFTIISLDESFFFYDSLIRRTWIEEKTYSKSDRLAQTFMYFWCCRHGRKTTLQTVGYIQWRYIPRVSKENTYQISKMLFVYG